MMSELGGQTVSVHSNLNLKCISLKHKKDPVLHLSDCVVTMQRVNFLCPPKGHENATKVRSVYARIKGTLTKVDSQKRMPPKTKLMQVRLNPKERPQLNYFHTIELGDGRETVEVRKILRAPVVWIEHTTGEAPKAWVRRDDAESGWCS